MCTLEVPPGVLAGLVTAPTILYFGGGAGGYRAVGRKAMEQKIYVLLDDKAAAFQNGMPRSLDVVLTRLWSAQSVLYEECDEQS
jgi:hypothetical protein